MHPFRNRSKTEKLELTITTQTFVRVLLLILGTIGILGAIHMAAHALLLIFIAFFLALALNAPVHWVSRHLPKKQRGNRALATSVSFLIVIVLLGAFLASMVPPLVRQTQSFINSAPHLVRDLKSQDSEIGKAVRRYHLQGQVNTFSSELSDRLKNVSGTALSAATEVGSSIFATLTVLVLTFMMLVEGPEWLKFFRRLIPERHRANTDEIIGDMYRVVKGYVNGQVTLAAIAAAFIVPALFILHISYPIALMVVVFVCGLIPMVGHTIGAIIVTTVALFHSPASALIILAYYILYQQTENYLIQPRIQANSTNLSPLLVFTSVVIGVSFSGLLGGLVAIPIAGCLRVLVLFYLESEHKLRPAEVENQLNPKKS
jgi:predicted PurR-regulated permease PerM